MSPFLSLSFLLYPILCPPRRRFAHRAESLKLPPLLGIFVQKQACFPQPHCSRTLESFFSPWMRHKLRHPQRPPISKKLLEWWPPLERIRPLHEIFSPRDPHPLLYSLLRVVINSHCVSSKKIPSSLNKIFNPRALPIPREPFFYLSSFLRHSLLNNKMNSKRAILSKDFRAKPPPKPTELVSRTLAPPFFPIIKFPPLRRRSFIGISQHAPPIV